MSFFREKFTTNFRHKSPSTGYMPALTAFSLVLQTFIDPAVAKWRFLSASSDLQPNLIEDGINQQTRVGDTVLSTCGSSKGSFGKHSFSHRNSAKGQQSCHRNLLTFR
jgi:hypothetical protein